MIYDGRCAIVASLEREEWTAATQTKLKPSSQHEHGPSFIVCCA